jgi:hypothetical protein
MKTATRQPFRASGRDLYFDLHCTCPDPRWEGTEIAHLMQTKIMLTGYADDNFFDNVNAAPRDGACRCGRRYRAQWFRDGVEAAFTDPPGAPGAATPSEE